MLSVEFRFPFFFAVVFSVHWALRSNTARKWWPAPFFGARVCALLAVPLTFYWICVTWIFFRAAPAYNEKTHALEATGLQNAWLALKEFTFTGGRGKQHFDAKCFGILALFALLHWLNSRRAFGTWWRRLPDWACAALLGGGVAVALLFVPVKYKPFIYFQF